MQELISQLVRLYLPAGAAPPSGLARHLDGAATEGFDPVSDGAVRVIVISFDWPAGADGTAQWTLLCDVANALQGELGLPAPAVSISGASGYRLWLSFGAPVPVALAQRFLDLLRIAHFSGAPVPPEGVRAPVELPPCLNLSSGKWAAFIHPGMGASFAEEAGLDSAPPAAGQAAFLQGLESITVAQFEHALQVLQRAQGQAASPAAPASTPAQVPAQVPAHGPAHVPVPAGLLLKDATLEDIVRFLHEKNIEPTFRYLLPPR